jgi:dihydrolipoamide dehydrogenase
VGSSEGDVTVRTSNLIIATGSRPIELAHLPFGGTVISSTEALALTELPPALVIVGAGYIGLELGIAFRKLGSSVTIVEMLDRILPQYDQMLTRPVMKRLGQLDIPVMLETVATRLTESGDALVVTDAGDVEVELPADKVLVTVGRTTAVEGWGLETLDLDMDGSRIRIDDRCHTSMRGVYAIGDVTGEPMLAHRAMAQGEMVAEIIAGLRRSWDKRAIPEVCFTDPEIVSVGLSPEQAATDEIDCVVDSFAFAANGRALTLDRADGFVRIVARRDDHLVLGVQAVGPGVAELSSEFCLALEMGATLEDLAATVHAHPTLGEAVPEAALKALGRGLHSR